MSLNSSEFLKVATKVALSTLPGSSLASLIYDATVSSIENSKRVASEGDISKLQEETTKQELENRISEFQARVAQELAIAKRIENAEEVEIEEFYDTSGEGGIGLQHKEGAFNIGASGLGRKVTRRVYRFKGNLGIVNEYESQASSSSNELEATPESEDL